MTCRDILELVEAIAAGEQPGAAGRAHLETCPRCVFNGAMVVAALLVMAGLAGIFNVGMVVARELAHRERMAMIERGLAPAPEIDPGQFETRDRFDDAAGNWNRAEAGRTVPYRGGGDDRFGPRPGVHDRPHRGHAGGWLGHRRSVGSRLAPLSLLNYFLIRGYR